MTNPEIGREPIAVEVDAGKIYWWCPCGRSKSQPFCDGSHRVTTFEPIEYKPAKSGKLFFLHMQAQQKETALRQ